MNELEKLSPPGELTATRAESATAGAAQTMSGRNTQRREARRWWIKLFVQPALLMASGAMLIAALGVTQKMGLISAGAASTDHSAQDGGTATRYICPMMCTPPQSEPGRCPVCAMELVPAAPGADDGISQSIQIDPAARRVANIQTVAVESIPMSHKIRAVGELSYDEGSLKTISAYVDGRLDRLYADYTGAVVEKGDHLAWLYSPRLYSAQVEFLLAKKSQDASATSTLTRVAETNRELYKSAKQRLIELGMTEPQIDHLEESGAANSRLHLCAPISGTVIEKLAVEGQYVDEGEAIYRLADLSSVWLMLKLFPEDAATIRYGQKVEAEVQSLPGQIFSGRVAFVDPHVDVKTRTVGVRVVMPNPEGLLRVGDYAKATINVPVGTTDHRAAYDPELADKWIGPRPPHVIESSPDKCPLCGVDAAPAPQLGFTATEKAQDKALVVPRDAVLMAGGHSVLYVETEPGRFELRRITLGPSSGEQIVILSGVEQGEQVATRGNFLIDSQMQLAGNPSLIDPAKAAPRADAALEGELLAALASLSPEDRRLVQLQRTCPVSDYQLGAMGPPIKVDVNGTPVFLCCEGCREELLAHPEKYLTKLAGAKDHGDRADGTSSGLPPIGNIEPLDAGSGLPPIDAPQLFIEAAEDGSASETPAGPIAEVPMEVVR